MGEDPSLLPNAPSMSEGHGHSASHDAPSESATTRPLGAAVEAAVEAGEALAGPEGGDRASPTSPEMSKASKARQWMLSGVVGGDGGSEGGGIRWKSRPEDDDPPRPVSAGSSFSNRPRTPKIVADKTSPGSFKYARPQVTRMMSPDTSPNTSMRERPATSPGASNSLPATAARSPDLAAAGSLSPNAVQSPETMVTSITAKGPEVTAAGRLSPHAVHGPRTTVPSMTAAGGLSPHAVASPKTLARRRSLLQVALEHQAEKTDMANRKPGDVSPLLGSRKPLRPLPGILGQDDDDAKGKSLGSGSGGADEGVDFDFARRSSGIGLGSLNVVQDELKVEAEGNQEKESEMTKSPKSPKSPVMAPASGEEGTSVTRRRPRTVVRQGSDVAAWPKKDGSASPAPETARSGASSNRSATSSTSAKGKSASASVTSSGGKGKDSGRKGMDSGRKGSIAGGVGDVRGSMHRQRSSIHVGVGNESKTAKEKAKAKEAEEKAKVLAAEKEKQNQARLAKEAKDREGATLAHRKKMREQGLINFETTRKKDAADKVVFHDQAVEKAQQAAWSLLWEAARDGDMDKVRALVDPQPVTYLDRNNKTRDRPISVDMKHVDWAAEALGGGAGNDPRTWLTSACPVNIAGGQMSRTALHAACSSGRTDVVQMLCEEYGAKIDLPDAAGRPPLWDAARHGHLEVVQFLVDAGAAVDTPDMAGNTPTHMAVKNGHHIVVQVLVDAGADLLCVNKEGKMAKEMSSAGSKLSMYLRSLGELQQSTIEPKQDLQLHEDGSQRRDHPDPIHRLRQGYSMYVRSAFFVCERHIESGEYFIKKTLDGFRSTDIAHGPLPAVSAIAAAQSGLVLIALADGRIMRTLDDFQTVTFVHPGVAHGDGAHLARLDADQASFGAPLHYIKAIDSNTAYAVGEAPPKKESVKERIRALKQKAHAAYQMLGSDGSNQLDQREMQEVAKLLGAELSKDVADKMVQDNDEEGNGKCDFKIFFRWFRDEILSRDEDAHPLLLCTRNGGYSFERLGIPSEAMEIFSGEDVTLISVAFGGKDNSTGVVLARYGKGQSLLLVSQDGGHYWKCVDPQRWYEAEQERIENEKVQAARQMAMDLHKSRALARKAMEEAAQKRREEEEANPPEQEETKEANADADKGKLPAIAGKKGAAGSKGQLSARGSSRRGSNAGSSDGSTSARGSARRADGGGQSSRDAPLSSRSSRWGRNEDAASGDQSARSSRGDLSARKGDLSSKGTAGKPVSRQASSRGVKDKDKGDMDKQDSVGTTLPSFKPQAGIVPMKRQGSGRLMGMKSPKGILDANEGEALILPEIGVGGDAAELSKDARIAEKEDKLRALLEAKQKAKKEEEAAAAKAKAEENAAKKKAQEAAAATQKEAESRTSSAASEQDETVIEIAGRLSRLERDGSKALLTVSKVDDSDDDEEDEEEEKRLGEMLGDDQIELQALSSDEEDESVGTNKWCNVNPEDEIRTVRPDWVPKIDVVGLAEKYLDADDDDDDEEEGEDEEEEEQEGSEAGSQESSRSSMTGTYSVQSSARSTMMRGFSKRNMGRMESSRAPPMLSAKSDAPSNVSISSILSSRGYMTNMNDQYKDNELEQYSLLSEKDLGEAIKDKPESEQQMIKLAAGIVRGLQHDTGVPARSNSSGSPSVSSPLTSVAASEKPSSPLNGAAASNNTARSSSASSTTSYISSAMPQGVGSPVGTLVKSASSKQMAGKPKQVIRLATGRIFTPAPVKEKMTRTSLDSGPSSLLDRSAPGSARSQGSSKSLMNSSADSKTGSLSRQNSVKKSTSSGDSTSKLKKQGSSKSNKAEKEKEAQAPTQKQLRGLREFTFDKMLELQRTRLQRDLESTEGEERLSTIDLREAILNQKVEGIQGGPLTGKKIAAQKRTVAARQATLDMIQKIKDICDQSVEHLTSIRDKEKELLAETLAKAAAKEEEKAKLPKRRSEETQKKKEQLEKELEDLEYDKTYYSTNVGYVEEAIEEEVALQAEMLHGRPCIDTWGSRGLDTLAGVVAGGYWLTGLAVVSDGAILVSGAGGVQRSDDGGKTWKRTFVLSAEVDCTHMQAINDRVFALVEGCIHRSDDGGLSWQMLGKLPPHQVAVRSLFCFIDEEHGFAGNERGSIYFTCDGGVTWEQRTSVAAQMRFVPLTLSGLGRVPA